jgi:RimJ/RimL family protein N-acetyltransferase
VDDRPGPEVTPRVVRLPHDREVVVRIGGPDDADGLARLYGELDADDRYRRFFCAGRPPRSLVERWARSAADGGVLLVAELHRPDGAPPSLIAEAGYHVLDNGNGELGITVSPHWRGWLGPYLLDALTEEAAARGVPGLEAEILVDNRAMQALLRSRGLALAARPDHTTVRYVISTTGRVPQWPARRRGPRVLVEGHGGTWRGAAAARAAGAEVLGCPGPEGRPGRRCPVLDGGTCPLVEGADAVVVTRRDDTGDAAALADTLAEAHRRAHPELMVLVDDGHDRTDEALTAWIAGRLPPPTDGGAR